MRWGQSKINQSDILSGNITSGACSFGKCKREIKHEKGGQRRWHQSRVRSWPIKKV